MNLGILCAPSIDSPPPETMVCYRQTSFEIRIASVSLIFFALWLIPLAGCDSEIDRFEPNEVFALTLARSRDTEAEAAMTDTTLVISAMFGTPSEPKWPAEWIGNDDLAGIVDPDALARAAGPVSSDREGVNLGLYRKHCVDCHGLSGNGAGGASMLQNPYPRNFRHGVFKWKSTERAAKPTREDLVALLHHGIPGTAMPSFSLLSGSDVAALIDYVIYLSVRGEVERRLMAAAIDELGYEDTPPDAEWRLPIGENDQTKSIDLIRETLIGVVSQWHESNDKVVAVDPIVDPQGAELNASIERGKEIFHGQIANCVGCHGPSGNGQAVTVDFDDWSKEYSTQLGITPTDREAMRPFRDAGAPRPRQILPRNLQDGVFHGGGSPEAIYRRIAVGIAGTPMPGVEVVPELNSKGLTSDQVWDLVRYVQSLAK